MYVRCLRIHTHAHALNNNVIRRYEDVGGNWRRLGTFNLMHDAELGNKGISTAGQLVITYDRATAGGEETVT